MIYGYCRVSSKGQERYGSSLESQEELLRQRGAVTIYKEAYTGTKMCRPVFDKLMSELEIGDTLMVTKLDRLARTVLEGAEIVQSLVERGIIVDIANMGRAENTPMGKLMVYMLLAIAEFERDTIMERLNGGKEAKRKAGGKCEGRNTLLLPEFDRVYEDFVGGKMTVSECCEYLNISRSTWYNRVREMKSA